MTYSEFVRLHAGRFFWHCDAGMVDGRACLDVLAYETLSDRESDTDNSLAVDRVTVIDDRFAQQAVGDAQ